MAKKSNKSKKKRKSVPRSKVLSKKSAGGGGASSGNPPHGRPPSNPVSVRSRAEFERYLDDDKPVIVDFWAPWCGPCKAMGPIFEQVGKEFEGKVHFLKVDTEQLQDVAGELGIRSIPTLLVFHGDEVTDSNVGLTAEGALRKMAQRADDRANGVTLGSKVKRLFGMGGKDAGSKEPSAPAAE